jgi:hypothetical protein
MRTRRPFVVLVLDANGEEVCRVDIFCTYFYLIIAVERERDIQLRVV